MNVFQYGQNTLFQWLFLGLDCCKLYKCNLPCGHGKRKKFKCVVTSAAMGFSLKLYSLCCGCCMDECPKYLSILAFHVHAELWCSARRILGVCRRAWSFFLSGQCAESSSSAWQCVLLHFIKKKKKTNYQVRCTQAFCSGQ